MAKYSKNQLFLALSSNANIGSKTILKLDKLYPDLNRLWSKDGLLKLKQTNLTNVLKNEIIKVVKAVDITQIEVNLAKLGIKYITVFSQEYPRILKEIPDPPAVLYYKGKMLKNDQMCFGVVGSRKFTGYGRRATGDIVCGLACAGLTVVSGLALGIDAIAHEETLKNHGLTIGVLGCGLDMIYPTNNIGLAQKIINTGGAIISEYPPKVPPYKSNFVLRNRIIAGHSLGILVVEAAKKSGTLLTAKAAIDYNREVFAVPGSIYSEASEGANNLIKYGARPATNSQDILDNLNIQVKECEERIKDIVADNAFEGKIITALKNSEGIHIDKLSKICDLKISDISSHLTLMEMKGKVKNLGGNIFVINK